MFYDKSSFKDSCGVAVDLPNLLKKHLTAVPRYAHDDPTMKYTKTMEQWRLEEPYTKTGSNLAVCGSKFRRLFEERNLLASAA